MFHSNGLIQDKVDSTTSALHKINEEDLSFTFALCVEIQNKFFNAILSDMFATREELLFWERVKKSNGWEITLSRLNSYLYSIMFARKDLVDDLYRDKKILNEYVEELRADFHVLSKFLAEIISIGASNLNKICTDVQDEEIFANYPARQHNHSLTMDQTETDELSIQQSIVKDLTSYLKQIHDSALVYIPNFIFPYNYKIVDQGNTEVLKSVSVLLYSTLDQFPIGKVSKLLLLDYIISIIIEMIFLRFLEGFFEFRNHSITSNSTI
jgi:hypothetical protein